jgi:hypothetical protein
MAQIHPRMRCILHPRDYGLGWTGKRPSRRSTPGSQPKIFTRYGVLPALLGGDVEDDVLVLVLSGFGFCVLSEAADEDDFVEHGVRLRFFWFVRFHEKAPKVKPFSRPARGWQSVCRHNDAKGLRFIAGPCLLSPN